MPSPFPRNSASGGTSPSASYSAAGGRQSPSSERKFKVKRDMNDLYQRKVENADRRIRRLEEQIREMEAAEQCAKEKLLEQQHQHMKQVPTASPKKISKESEEKMIQRLTYVREKDTNSVFPPIDNSRPAKQMWERLRPDKEFDEEDGEFDVEATVDRLGVQDVEMRNENTQRRLEEVAENGIDAMWRDSVRQISIARRRREEGEDFDEDEDDEELYVLSEEKMDALGNRLCRESLEHKRRVLEELEAKYYGADVNKSVEIERSKQKRIKAGVDDGKVPTPQEIGARLHDASMKSKQKTMEELEAKYVEKNKNLIRTKTGDLKELPKLSKDAFEDLVNRLSTKK